MVTTGGGAAEAYAFGVGGGSIGAASVNSVGGGTIVGWLVSMTIRSGGCCMEVIRMTGLMIGSLAGSGKGLGHCQSAKNNSARSAVPTQVVNRRIGITISLAAARDESKRRNC